MYHSGFYIMCEKKNFITRLWSLLLVVRALPLRTATMDTAAVFGTEMHDGIEVIFGDTCDVKFPRAVRDKWS